MQNENSFPLITQKCSQIHADYFYKIGILVSEYLREKIKLRQHPNQR
jgi:hypothetical protein